MTIVGVVGDTRDWAWSEPKIAQLYLPDTQNPSRIMHLVVRSSGDPTQLTSAVRHAVESVDPNQPVTDVKTMDDYLSVVLAQRRLNMTLLAFFAVVAALLAAIGIYGVMGYAVTQRSHEIGIRMALGAEPADVLRMIVGDGMKLTGMGLSLGLLGSLLGDEISRKPALRHQSPRSAHFRRRRGRLGSRRAGRLLFSSAPRHQSGSVGRITLRVREKMTLRVRYISERDQK